MKGRYELDLDATGGNERKALERLKRQARDDAKRVRALLSCPGGRAKGTPLLSALEAAAGAFADAAEPGVERRLVLYTDGAITNDELDVRDGISDAAMLAAIRRWPPRLRGLHGARVWIIGAESGQRGIPRETMRRVRLAIERILSKAGARLEAFGPDAGSYPL